jgi:cell division inhibitor SulA/protein ImuA
MSARVDELLAHPALWRGGQLAAVHPGLATGHLALDRELPGGGLPSGALSEILSDSRGIGELSFLAPLLGSAKADGRLVAWIAPPWLPYAPALVRAGLALDRMLVVQPEKGLDGLWSAEQALRSGACHAVLAWLDASLGRDGYAWLRRLAMAAETGKSCGILMRSMAAAGQPTPAQVRLALAPENERLSVRILKRRGPPCTHPIPIDLMREPPRQRRMPPALLPAAPNSLPLPLHRPTPLQIAR